MSAVRAAVDFFVLLLIPEGFDTRHAVAVSTGNSHWILEQSLTDLTGKAHAVELISLLSHFLSFHSSSNKWLQQCRRKKKNLTVEESPESEKHLPTLAAYSTKFSDPCTHAEDVSASEERNDL